jgi:NAD(P)H-dependent FMN reductase
MAGFDGYAFVVSEYNYGSAGGARAVEHLRGILSEVQVAHVGNAALLSLFTDFENFSALNPTEPATASVGPMLDQLPVWARAMEAVRVAAVAAVAAVGANA